MSLLPSSLQPLFLELLPREAEEVGNCWPAAAHGSDPSNPFLQLPSRNTGSWHVVIRSTQFTELGSGAEVHQIEQLLDHQQSSAAHRGVTSPCWNGSNFPCWNCPVQPLLKAGLCAWLHADNTCYASGWSSRPARGEFPRRICVQAWHTGRQVCLSQGQTPKSESGCGMYVSGEMDLVLSPKPDRRDITAPLQRQSQALGKEATLRQVRTDSNLLGAHSFLCSQLKGQLMSCRRPRSTSPTSSSEQQGVICGGLPHSQFLCWLPRGRHLHLPGRNMLRVTQPSAAQKALSPPLKSP